jgi:hypothetical protein
MTPFRRQADLLGRTFRTRLDTSSHEPSIGIRKLLAKLERAFVELPAMRWVRPQSGQEIGNRAGLFEGGETVKHRIGIPGLRFFAARARGNSQIQASGK